MGILDISEVFSGDNFRRTCMPLAHLARARARAYLARGLHGKFLSQAKHSTGLYHVICYKLMPWSFLKIT